MRAKQNKFAPAKTEIKESSLNVSNNTAKKIGLAGATTIILCSVIGAGIFFKNGSIFRNNNGNAIGIILSWVIAAIIALCTAFSFGEVCRCKTKSEESGLAGWAETYIGYRAGRFIKICYPLFYYSGLVAAMGVFASETIFNIAVKDREQGITTNVIWVILVGMAIVVFFASLHIISEKIGSKISSIATFIKFVPILLIVICGIIAGIVNPNNNMFINMPINEKGEPMYDGKFSMGGMLNSLPAVLFAFDSFLIIGNIKKDVVNPNKNVPFSILLSMIIIASFNILITIAQICAGAGNPYELFEMWLGSSAAATQALTIVFSILLMLVLFGTNNSFTMALMRSAQSGVDEEVIMGSKTLKKWGNGKSRLLPGFIVLIATQILWFLVLGIPSIILKNDQMYDAASSVACVCFFLIYGVVLLGSIINRITNKLSLSVAPRQKGQVVAGSIAFVGCLFVFVYSCFYTYLAYPIMNAKETFGGWGLFYNSDHYVNQMIAAILFWVFVVLFLLLPFINDLIIKMTNKNYDQPLMWQKINKKVSAPISK